MSDDRTREAAEILAGHAIKTCADEAHGDAVKLSNLLFGQADAMRSAADLVFNAAVKAVATPGGVP